MKLLLRQVRIIDPKSSFHNSQQDILIENGVILAIDKSITDDKAKLIDDKGLIICPSFFDLHVDFADPGFEHRETINSGLKAAEAGGFGGIVQMPCTQPVIQSKADIEYLLSQSSESSTELFVAAAASIDLKGEDLTEMFDLKSKGAVFFTNDKNGIQGSDVLELAIRYANSVGSFLACTAMDISMSEQGLMHEGPTSTILGLKGIPRSSEAIALDRIIKLAKENQARVHIMSVSTKEGVDLIKKAKDHGLQVTADVNAAHLLLCDEDLKEYDSNLKLFPPLGSSEDRESLRKAVLNGTIDAISSDHRPVEVEYKECEFDKAMFGMIGLQTCYSTCLEAFGSKNIDKWLPALFKGREIIGLENPCVEENAQANFSILSSSAKSLLAKHNNLSKSLNSYFLNKELKGKVLGLTV